jgi:serine/threonine protein kinase/Flp pilus assembly protein TadD
MPSPSSERSLVEVLADEFLARLKRGEKPTIKEYCGHHPDLADEIRDVFEAVLMVEDLKPGSEEISGSYGASVRMEGKRLEQVGDYRILREIGRGGMGVVYEAEQESLGRRVALKVLPKTLAGDGHALIRFQREAKAAARMHHTNIVPVFDVGQGGEHVYYAMQLIHGQGLDSVIDDLKRLRGQSQAGKSQADRSIAASLLAGRFEQEKLGDALDANATSAYEGSPPSSAVLPGQSELSSVESNRLAYYRSVAQIGVQTAGALAYAHARGIIHRDIKPGNLLLDAAGNVWVTDFGLAKTGDAGMTHTGDILGTIRYMSPERFRGQCDVRADVYALGMTLYEMLTLKAAYASGDRLKLIELIRTAEPPRPRSVDARIPRDLETIVLKAINKDAKRRYQSADEIGEDLQRFVNDEPIKARRIGPVERFTRWCRRSPALAASLAATLLILGLGLSLVSWKWNDERRARADADAAREEVEKKAAELAADIERMNMANRLLESGHEYMRVGGGNLRSYDFYTRATEVRPEHSATWTARAQLCINLGLWHLAAEDLAEAARLKALGADPNGFYRAALCLRYGDQAGFVQMRDSMLESADRNYFMNLDWVLRTSVLSPDAPEAVRKAMAEWQQKWDHLPREVRSQPWNLYVKGTAHYRLGQYNEALEELNRALEIGNWQALDIVYPIIAMVQFRLGRVDEANKALDRARQAADRWDAHIFANEHVFVPLPSPWNWLEFLWYFDEASKLITGSAPPESPRQLAVHARALAWLRKFDLAAEEFRRVAELAPNDPKTRFTCFKFQVVRKRWDAAAPPEAAIVELAAVTKLQPNDPQVHLNAFRVYADNGFWNEAKAQHQRAIELAPADRKITLEHYRYHVDRGEWPQAEAAYAEQLGRLPNDAELRIQCALLHADAKRWEQVYSEYAKILPMRRDDIGGAWYPYALACLKTGRVDEYQKISAELFERSEKTKGSRDALATCIICKLIPNPRIEGARLVAYARDRLGADYGIIGHCLYRNGQHAEAVEALTKSLGGEQHLGFFWSRYFLAMAYQQLGKYDLAVQWLREANQTFGDEKTLAARVTWWAHRLDLEMLREEAEQLILGKGRHRSMIADLIARGEWQAALDRLDALSKENELNSRDWTNRGRCYTGLAQWEQAVTAYDKAIALGAQGHVLWHNKGFAHNRKGEYGKALSAFERAEQIAKTPSSAMFHEQAIAYVGLRQFDKALAAADGAIELGDNSPWLRYHRGSALAGAGKLPAAIEDFTRAAEGPSAQRTIFLSKVAALHVANRDLAAYRQLCAKLFDEFKGTDTVYNFNNLCWVMCFAPDAHPELRSLADRAVKVLTSNLKNHAWLNTAGCFLYRAGRDDEAIKWLQASMKAGDADPTDWIFLAMVHQRQGRPEEARMWLNKAKAHLADASEGKVTLEPVERLTLECLIREAESVPAASK